MSWPARVRGEGRRWVGDPQHLRGWPRRLFWSQQVAGPRPCGPGRRRQSAEHRDPDARQREANQGCQRVLEEERTILKKAAGRDPGTRSPRRQGCLPRSES